MTSFSQDLYKSKGFTLVELMVTVVVLAIVATIGIPSFIGLLERNRATASANELLGSIQFTRSEAVRLNTTSRICPSNDGTTCSGAWTDGWVVLRGTTDEVVRVGQENAAVTITGPTEVEFGSAGNVISTVPSGGINFEVTSGGTNRCVSVFLSGVAEVEGC